MLKASTVQKESCRREYLSPDHQPEFYNDLAKTLGEAWRLLESGASDRRSPFHTPALGTIDSDGCPSVRTVVLRAADRNQRLLRFHTDIRSAKCREIAVSPNVSVHFYDAGSKIQLRVRGVARVHCSDVMATSAWEETRPFSRVCYTVQSAPGTRLRDPRKIERVRNDEAMETGRANFAAIHVSISTLEWLFLAAHGHRRAFIRLILSVTPLPGSCPEICMISRS